MKISATAVRLALVGASLLAIPSAARAQFERIVLLEEYTSVTCVPCATAGRNVNTVLDANLRRLVTVRYHTNFLPSPKDRFYEANKPENEGRKAYYSWAAMPAVRVDGTTSITGTNKTELETIVADAMAVTAPLQLTVAHNGIEAGAYRVTVTAVAGPDGIPEGTKLRVVAVESLVHDPLYANSPYNGETDVRDIMRQFLTGVGGVDISLGPDETKVFTYTYTPDASWQSGQMHAVAFVQDEFDKTVLQAGFSPRPVSSVDSPELAGYSARTISANPTSGDVRIEYALGGPGRLEVSVIDVAGDAVRTLPSRERTSASQGTLSVDLADMPAGVYTVMLRSGAWRWSERIAVVR